MLLSLESLNIVGAFVFPLAGAMRWSHRWSEIHRPAGVLEHAQTGMGVPQELGRSCCLQERGSGWGYRMNNPRPVAWHSVAAGAKRTECSRGTVCAKATKRNGKDSRKSQCLDSTVEAGEHTPAWTPWREARHRDHGPVVGTYVECLVIRERISRTTTDNRQGTCRLVLSCSESMS